VVCNLKDLSYFDGNYTAAIADLTVAAGGSAAVMRNERGVVIKLSSTTAGLRFNLSADGIKVRQPILSSLRGLARDSSRLLG
jgi:hypothetical protein